MRQCPGCSRRQRRSSMLMSAYGSAYGSRVGFGVFRAGVSRNRVWRGHAMGRERMSSGALYKSFGITISFYPCIESTHATTQRLTITLHATPHAVFTCLHRTMLGFCSPSTLRGGAHGRQRHTPPLNFVGFPFCIARNTLREWPWRQQRRPPFCDTNRAEVPHV